MAKEQLYDPDIIAKLLDLEGGPRSVNYLVQNGIASSRIQTRSYGEEKPAVEGHDESAWSRNRRGEFGIYDTAQRK